MKQPSAQPSRVFRWMRTFAKAVLVLAILLTAASIGGWYYMFGRTGEPVASQPIEYIPSQQEQDWNRCRVWFERMEKTLKRTNDVVGVMHKQELVDGRLEPVTKLEIKLRKQPKSIYLKWQEPFAGREVLFQLRERKNRMIAHEGDPLRRVSPDVIMSLDHALAMKFSRHPIDELSLQYMIAEMPKYLADAADKPDLEISIDEQQQLDGRECAHIRFRYPPGTVGPIAYRRFDIYIATDDYMPLRWERYGPPTAGEDILVEYFEIVEYVRNTGLTDVDFDPANESYNFNSRWVMELSP